MNLSKTISFFRKFKKDQDGVALVEFAMLLPLLMLLAAGSFEVGRYALLTQKTDRIAAIALGYVGQIRVGRCLGSLVLVVAGLPLDRGTLELAEGGVQLRYVHEAE
jgi:Flp pilus assembly pilin Flp